MKLLLTALSSLLLGAGSISAHDGVKHPAGVPTTYPLKKCVVSGDALGGEMGKPVKVTHDHTDVYLCCKSCIKDFQKDPGKFTAMVKAAHKH